MKKVLIEFVVIVFILLTGWFLLSQIDWMTVFKVERVSRHMEEKIGNMFVDMLEKTETEVKSPSVVSPIDSLVTRICENNHIKKQQIKIHIIEKNEVNAFALPNHHIVVYTGLIEACKNESEFCGVLCHELAHLQKKHVMNKLIKDVGLSVIVSMAKGNGDGAIIKKTFQQLSSTAYDRKLESEADLTAVDYLINADIDPVPFADFLYRLGEDEKLPSQLYWISTHPESKERSQCIRDHIKNRTVSKIPILNESRWTWIKKRVKEE